MKTRPDGLIPTAIVGETHHYDILMRVYVRSYRGLVLPDKRAVENRISDLLLSMPRLDTGTEWDVSATSLPSNKDEDDIQLLTDPPEDRCPHGQFHTGAGACPACEGGCKSLKEPVR